MFVFNCLVFQVYVQLVFRLPGAIGKKLFNLLGIQNDWQHTILKTIVVEYVAKRFADNALEAVISQGPNGVFPTGTAAEIPPNHKDRCARICRMI